MPQSIEWYELHAGDVVQAYEAVDSAKLHSWLEDLISTPPSTVLDIGAGGRDAAWFAKKGCDVVAVEPSSRMRSEGQRLHTDPRIQWIDDQLPELGSLDRLGLNFDVIFLNAVWQHLPPSQRERSFRKIAKLLKAGGLLALTLRLGAVPDGRGMYPVSLDEVERLARNRGFAVEKINRDRDLQGRDRVSWVGIALRLPDDGTYALPLLRHLILNDQKSGTHKLGLLRALCRAADGFAGLVREPEDGAVKVPLGLVSLIWLRLYMRLIQEDLPQTPDGKLGFLKDAFRNFARECRASDLRVGARFTGARGQHLHSALLDVTRTIDRMPATFMKYPMGAKIFPVERHHLRTRAMSHTVEINAKYLETYGWIKVPTYLWLAMRRNAAWIEPTIIAAWTQLMRDYAKKLERRDRLEERMAAAMCWSDPGRDVSAVREIALNILKSGKLNCVWTVAGRSGPGGASKCQPGCSLI